MPCPRASVIPELVDVSVRMNVEDNKVESPTPNRARHVDQADRTVETRPPTAAGQRTHEFGCSWL